MRAEPTARTSMAHLRWQSPVSEVMNPLSLFSLVFETHLLLILGQGTLFRSPELSFRAGGQGFHWLL